MQTVIKEARDGMICNPCSRNKPRRCGVPDHSELELACAAMRVRVRYGVERGEHVIEGEIVAMAHSIAHVRPTG